MGESNVLVACTGSVASIKIPKLIEHLTNSHTKIEVKLVTTQNATHFFNPEELPVKVHKDAEEWESWKKIGDPVLHIELRRWADLMVIAPLDANTMAKITNGICDNLLTCIVRAWDMKRPLLFAPAMNTHMWEHPLTAQHLTTLKGLGYQEIPCIRKTLACGDTGYGAMAEVETIAAQVMAALPSQQHPTSSQQS
ncbi:phosphopantothenoylcysteine decarboxylase-like [Haliotis rufescens]|uniref:phosphopantothenoylcysteine decarboxylase-like n=1 Tax=Haliotis rufescens TaxID=6454 RepID=UPI00201F3242|nr:phosphopantothenoylcysteine decarboxylase-like [Haliotis rufescens]